MITKVMICPYFGQLPSWMDHWYANTERLKEHGYDFLFDDDEDAFKDRVYETLGIEPPRMWGTGKIWDFRPALGLLYEDEIADFDFWGHTDFDCVYGRVEKWMTDTFLNGLDVFSNHEDYIMGAWSLYRNRHDINVAFMRAPEWGLRMTAPVPSGWAEDGFSKLLDRLHIEGEIVLRYESFQTRDWDSFETLKLRRDGRLVEGRREVMMCHFRRTKQYPSGCVL